MKKTIRILGIVGVVLLLASVTVSTALAARNPFVGSWQSTDIDGSYQILTVGGGPGDSHFVRYYDFGASICQDMEYAASGSATLTESGDVLVGEMPIYCQYTPPEFWGNAEFNFTYHAATDTLTDDIGVTWTRR